MDYAYNIDTMCDANGSPYSGYVADQANRNFVVMIMENEHPCTNIMPTPTGR